MARLDLGKVVPEKGIDYFTSNDKQELVYDVLQEITIPTKVSQLTNDSGFIVNTVDNLTNYYKTSETYTKTEVDNKISSVYKYKGSVATYRNLIEILDLTIGDVYNVESDGSNYAWTGTEWDKLGGNIDLSGYQTKIDSSHKLSSDLVDDTNNTNKFVTNVEKTTWNGKANASDVYNKTDSDNRYLQNSKIVILTQAEYDALLTKDATVYYLIKEV